MEGEERGESARGERDREERTRRDRVWERARRRKEGRAEREGGR